MERTPIMQRFIELEITKALVNSRLAYDHPMRDVLESEAEITGVRQAYAGVPDGQDGWLMLVERIEQLKSDPRFRDSIPNPERVGRNDELSVRNHFEEIVRGTTVVE
jgi:hypothetical protein